MLARMEAARPDDTPRTLTATMPAKPQADEQAQLWQLVTELQRRIEVLERGRGARDGADEALVLAFVASTEGRSFSASALWRHASVDPVLADALEAADIDSATAARLVSASAYRVTPSPVGAIEQARRDSRGHSVAVAMLCELEASASEPATLPVCEHSKISRKKWNAVTRRRRLSSRHSRPVCLRYHVRHGDPADADRLFHVCGRRSPSLWR